MRLTVFTPTYNRGYIIEKLYRSLQRQTFHDFEWVVVDDGSSDNTESLFQSFMSGDNFFPIRYIKVKNGGKHRAINRGVLEASGELFFIVDSDDYLTDDALAVIDSVEKTIPDSQKSHFGGVCGLKAYDLNTPIGTSFSGDFLDITSLERPKHKINGDKAEVFYTSIIKQYPFPEFENENFLTECVVWDRIAEDGYKLRFFNEISMICNYLDDGLTAQSYNIFKNNPKGWGLYIQQNVRLKKICGLDKWDTYLRYYYSLRNSLPFSQIAKNLAVPCIRLRLRILGMQIYGKIYSK